MKNTPSSRKKGTQAEEVVAQYLHHSGYTILQRNIYTPFGEIDILAKKEGEYVCVEVRSRERESGQPPELTLNQKKYLHLVRSLLYLPFLHNQPTRIDLITVIGGKVRHHFRNVSP